MADGHGTTVVFGTSSFAAPIISIDSIDLQREAIEDTNMSSTSGHEFAPSSLYSWTMTMTVEHAAGVAVPIGGAVETVTITFGGSGTAWASSGFMTGYTVNTVQAGERMTASVTIQGTGAVTGITGS